MKLAFNVYAPRNSMGNKYPIILLHELASSKFTWKEVAPEIAACTGRKVYAVDMRNHGDSGWSDDFSYDSLANDVDEFMQKHNMPKAVLIGHRMGGIPAMTFALKKPDKVENLILEEECPNNPWKEALQNIRGYLNLWKEAISDVPKMSDEISAAAAVKNRVAELMKQKMYPDGFLDGDTLDQLQWRMKLDEDGTRMWKCNFDGLDKAFANENYVKQRYSGEYHREALFIYGTLSMFKIQDKEEEIKKYFPRAELLPMEGAKHGIHACFPKEFIKAVSDYINRGK